jgi:hypothetical protein
VKKPIPMLFLCAAFAALGAPNASAHVEIYRAILDGPSEHPANDSLGTGTAKATFDLDLVTMTVEASFSNLEGNTTAAHIHCCTVNPGVLTAGVATETPSFTNFPLGVTAGSMPATTFDMGIASSYNAAFITANGGTVGNALNALLAGIASGRAYFNIHTSDTPAGEIRGFLFLVPEPSTLLLAFSGTLVLMTRRRTR